MDYTEITTLGQSLRQIDEKLLTQERHGVRRLWYQGGEPYFDLFVEVKDQAIQWFQLTLRGHSLSWSRKCDRWQTGITNELRTDDITFYPASKVIDSDRTIDSEFFHIAQSIIATRQEEPIFNQLLTLFQTHRLSQPL